MPFEGQNTHKADLAFIRSSMATPLLERDNEQALARRWRDHGDKRAMQTLVEAHMRLVVALASKFKHYQLPMGDIIQEGNLGLMLAINRYEPEREVRFSTYAAWWIRSCIQDYVLRNWSIVRTGTTAAHKSLFFNLRRLRARIAGAEHEGHLSQEGREKIAEELGVHLRDVEVMESRLSGPDQSLNLTIGEDGADELQNFLPDTAPTPEENAIFTMDRQKQRDLLSHAFEELTERERRIIAARKLLDENITLEQLGHMLGVSKERVRQLEMRAMQKLRRAVEARMPQPRDLYLAA